MADGISQDGTNYSGNNGTDNSIIRSKKSRVLAIHKPRLAIVTNKDKYVACINNQTENILYHKGQHKLIPPKKQSLRLKKCHNNLHKKIQKRLSNRLKNKELKHLYKKANFRKLLAQAIMRKVELEMLSALDARDNVLRGHMPKNHSLEFELARVEKGLRRFLRLDNFYRRNINLENVYKSDEENIRQLFSSSYNLSLDFHCPHDVLKDIAIG